MKKLLLTLMMVATCSLMQAQVKPMVLGDKHALLKMEQGSRYLLLPVQESEDIAAIAVLDGHNNMVQRINVKLAIERVDYYVPYELKGACLMDIEFRGDRRQKGAVGDFVCWKDMKYTNTFDTTNREQYRPAYHHTPLYGWMNDPNGMFYKDGIWHLYYQWNPYGSQWENMTWGHSTSRDLIHWEAQPAALEMDWLGSIFSGSFFLRVMKTRWFFIISVCLMAASMVLMFSGESKTVLYTAIALVGYGNSNIFSMAFSEALLSVPDKQNEVSGLMIMGLFGGTIFPLVMGFMSDTMGQAGAVAVMAIGVIYLFTYIPRIKR